VLFGADSGAEMAMKVADCILGQMKTPILVLHEYSHAIFGNPAFYEAFNVAPGTLCRKSPRAVLQAEPETSLLRTILETVLNSKEGVEGILVENPEKKRIYSMNSRRLHFGGRVTDIILVEMFHVTKEHERGLQIQALNATLLERKAELEHINQDLESFTHSASHDLRAPLRLVNRLAHLLMEGYRSVLPAEALRMIESIIDSTNEIGRLLEKLLMFSQVSHAALQPRPVDLTQLALRVGADLETMGLMRLSDITVEKIPPVEADPALLKQVMVNLLSNAAKFTRQRDAAEIRVGSIQADGEIRYFVQDNGVGFDMDEVGALFVPFRRLNSAEQFDGSGLGLALVKRIVQHHGGRVWAEGQLQRGATIYFTLGDRN